MKKGEGKLNFITGAILILVGLFMVFLLLPLEPPKNDLSSNGVTFSTRAVEALGLEWEEAYRAMLDDLEPDIIRLPVYWNRLETNRDTYDWTEFDRQFELLEGKKTRVLLAIGMKLPRWPECHLPEWAESLSEAEVETELFTMLQDVVSRYKDHVHLAMWQVENELLFSFGECPSWASDRERLKKEILLVRSLDLSHPIMTTDSGELSTWLRTSTLPIDVLGISLYRTAYNDWHSYFDWPVNPYFYKLHLQLLRPFVDQLVITELQMEPWGPETVDLLESGAVERSFPVEDFANRYDFAQRTGATDIFGWGVEWWYYMDIVRNDNRYWEKAKDFFNGPQDLNYEA